MINDVRFCNVAPLRHCGGVPYCDKYATLLKAMDWLGALMLALEALVGFSNSQ